jgi:hypothetical protein
MSVLTSMIVLARLFAFSRRVGRDMGEKWGQSSWPALGLVLLVRTVAKEEVVPILIVTAHLFQPTGERGVRTTNKANEHGYIHAFRQKPAHEFDLLGVAFQVVQRGIDATGEDFGAGLALEALNAVVRTIADEVVEVVVGHATVVALKIGASKSARTDTFLVSTAAFALGIRTKVSFGT